jgi:hypothetical protein
MKTCKTEPPMNHTKKVKTFDIQLPITGEDLGLEVRKAFDLAKSSGRELTVYFSAVGNDPVYTPKSERDLGCDCYS